MRSYLYNRQQFVSFDDFNSDKLNIICGVPQGSILGPKLFILFINDICNVSKNLKFIIFADDTNIFCSGKNINELLLMVNLELQKLCTWFSVNKLTLNISKTNFMLFTNHNVQSPSDIKICIKGQNIERVKVTKFLGVLIDEKLSWKEHISLVHNKICKSLSILYKIRTIFDSHILRLLYCSLILPYLTYCTEIWGNNHKSYIHSILLLQKKAIRVISGVGKFEHTDQLFYMWKLLKIHDLVELKILLVMYKAFHHILPSNIQCLFENKPQELHVTRQKNRFTVKYVRTTLKSKSVSVTGVKLWNNLNNSLISSITIHSFKRNVKNMLINKYKF